MEQKGGIASFLPLILIFVLFYFLLIKPQQKKAKQQREMLNSLKVGDELILSSGLIAVIDEIPANKEYIFVKLNDKNIVRVFKDAIIEKYIEEKNTNNSDTGIKKNIKNK